MEKLQKGGNFQTDGDFYPTFGTNLFLFFCNIIILICLLIFNNLYNAVWILFMVLIVISFCTFLFMCLFNPVGKSLFGYSKNYDIILLLSCLFLCGGGVAQFISVILIFIVFNSNKPKSNKMKLTNSNASNLLNYETFYIFAYLLSIVTFITIMAIDNGFDNFEMRICLVTVLSIFLLLVYFSFNNGWKLYYNVIIKGNQLFQGTPTNLIDGGKQLGDSNIKPTTPVPSKLPVCTKPANTAPGSTPDPNKDQCY
uniref:Uncharacterized protein n=1 Tax=viral metagenome TaxID=1070528 RepID=A0A6C0HZU7_9ZZZZ